MSSEPLFTFIDLFAGIGGIRIAFESVGGECVFSSEYDKFAQQTYRAFFGETPDFSEIMAVDPPGDITKLDPSLVPDHDILTGGFPCQPFSIAGVSKKNSLGRPHGFDDPTQGNLFFNIAKILEIKRPKAFFLENVKNLTTHDNGRTFSIIKETLIGLEYEIFYRVVDAAGWVPQHRKRTYIIGFRKPQTAEDWFVLNFPEFMELEKPNKRPIELIDILEDQVPDHFTLTDGTWNALKRHKERHLSKGRGFGYSLITKPFDDKVTRTLSARYYKDGAEVLLDQEGKVPRRLTPYECAKLMGFPEKYQSFFDRNTPTPQPVSDNQAYKQFGNSVVVPVVMEIAQVLVNKLKSVNALD